MQQPLQIEPLFIAVGQMANFRHRYGVTLPWFSTWFDVEDRIHHEYEMTINHPIVAEELQDALMRVFNFNAPLRCFFYDKGDGPRLWGSFERA